MFDGNPQRKQYISKVNQFHSISIHNFIIGFVCVCVCVFVRLINKLLCLGLLFYNIHNNDTNELDDFLPVFRKKKLVH